MLVNHKKYLFDKTFFHIGLMRAGGGGEGVGGGGGAGGGGVVDERYVTLGVYRSATRSVTRGWGVKFSGENRYITIK